MKIIYLIQTYKNPEQIYRLVRIIKKSSPNSYILVSHNFRLCNLDINVLRELPNVEVINSQVERGDFSLVQSYLDAINWLFSHCIEFDWLINLTGQDYPTQPLSRIEKFLAETKYDGFLTYFDAVSDYECNPWGSREGRDRYLYQYKRLCGCLLPWQRAFLKLPRIIINNVQSLIRISSSYGLMVGIRANLTPFDDDFLCYGGSYFHTLSRKCIQYLYDFLHQKTDFTSYYQNTRIPDESVIQTILINSKLFNICNDNKRYVVFENSQCGHPQILTWKDYPTLMQEDIHFARKFDIEKDSKILDMLDTKILQ